MLIGSKILGIRVDSILKKKEVELNLFTKFNRKSIHNRQIDTFIGISKGLDADGKVDQSETEFLLSWLIQSRETTDNPGRLKGHCII